MTIAHQKKAQINLHTQSLLLKNTDHIQSSPMMKNTRMELTYGYACTYEYLCGCSYMHACIHIYTKTLHTYVHKDIYMIKLVFF